MDRRTFLALSAATGIGATLAPAGGALAQQAATPVAAIREELVPLTTPLDPAVLGSATAPLPGVSIAPEFYPVEVTVRRDIAPGSIIILSSQHYLYLVTRKGYAIRYGVGVGRAELVYRGEAIVGKKAEWPSWRPTNEMIARNPAAYAKYAENGMEGGPKNPLGARALYLYQDGRDTTVRIHGTVEPNSIGKSVSNGCIRMINAHVVDLYSRVPMGTAVSVF